MTLLVTLIITVNQQTSTCLDPHLWLPLPNLSLLVRHTLPVVPYLRRETLTSHPTPNPDINQKVEYLSTIVNRYDLDQDGHFIEREVETIAHPEFESLAIL